MNIHFKDRFNRKFLKIPEFPKKIVYDQVGNAYSFNRDNLPAIFWLDGDIFWYNTKLYRYCTTGPSKSMINGELGYSLNGKEMSKMEWLIAIE